MTGGRRNRGFTLIELTVAVTIFAIIAVSIFTTFNTGIKVWRKSTPLMENSQSRMVFFDVISLDLKNAVAYTVVPDANAPQVVSAGNGNQHVGMKLDLDSDTEDQLVNFEGKPDRIAFTCVKSVYDPVTGLRSELAKVIYRYDAESKTVKRFVATKAEGFGFDEALAKSSDMLEKIEAKDFGFEYCYKIMSTGTPNSASTDYEIEWVKAWAGEKNVRMIPRGVRIKVGELVKTVFIPTGTLGEEEAE